MRLSVVGYVTIEHGAQSNQKNLNKPIPKTVHAATLES